MTWERPGDHRGLQKRKREARGEVGCLFSHGYEILSLLVFSPSPNKTNKQTNSHMHLTTCPFLTFFVCQHSLAEPHNFNFTLSLRTQGQLCTPPTSPLLLCSCYTRLTFALSRGRGAMRRRWVVRSICALITLKRPCSIF